MIINFITQYAKLIVNNPDDISVEKKELDKEKGQKIKYKYMTEFKVDEDLLNKYQVYQFFLKLTLYHF